MKAKLFTLFVFLLIAKLVISQNVSIEKEANVDLLDLYEDQLIQPTIGNEVLLTDMNRLIKHNFNNITWTRTFGSRVGLTCALEKTDGYYICGYDDTNGRRSFFARLNKSNGNVEVSAIISSNDAEKAEYMVEDHDGSIILGGYLGNNASIRRVNNAGTSLFLKTTHGGNGLWGEHIKKIIKSNDGGYYIFGAVDRSVVGCGELNWTLWIAKLNASFNVSWSKRYEFDGCDSFVDAEVIGGNIYILTDVSDIQQYPNRLIKTDLNGNQINTQLIGSNLLDFRINYEDLAQTCDYQLLIAGNNGGLLGSRYFIEKVNSNLEITGELFGSEVNMDGKSCNQIELGHDGKFYLLGRYLDRNLLSRTTKDPACVTIPEVLCDLPTFPVKYKDCENFEGYQPENISPQGNPRFTLFSNVSSQQAIIENSNNSKVLTFGNTSDIDYNISRTISTNTRLEWMTYMPNNRTGSCGLETREVTPSNGVTYALEVDFKLAGIGKVYTYNSSNQKVESASFLFPNSKWFKVSIIFNPDLDQIELWVDCKYVYTLTNYQSNQITDLNWYGTSGLSTNQFYIDNLLYYELNAPCITTQEYNPVCVKSNENKVFSNPSKAQCAGFTECEWTQGPCSGNGGSTSLVFDIEDNICGPVGQIVTIPVKVKGFSKVSSFQFTINIPDNTKGEITTIEKGNIIGDLNFGLISPTTATVVWDNTAPVDLTDNTVVLNIKVRIKTLFTGSAEINILGSPTDISADQNNQAVIPSVITGSFCATASSYKICGKITREDEVAIPNVIVTLSGGKSAIATTNFNGEYCFENLDANLSYTVKPSKNTDHKNGINGGDVTAIRKHILALEKLNSSYKIIAADASKTNAVNTGDVTEIRKLILALINQFSTSESWAFVPKSHVFINPTNPFAASIPNTINVSNLTNDISDQNFIGIKIGDVNLSNNPSNATDFLQNRTSADINLIVGSANVVGNQNFDIDITVRQFNEITSGQFSVNWNTGLIDFVSLKNLNTTLGMTNDNFNATQTSFGELGFLWDSPTPISLPDDSKLFTLSFKAKSNGVANINISDVPVGKYFEDKDKKELNIVVTDGIITVPTEEERIDTNIKVFPNPTSGIITLESSRHKIHNIQVFSLDGALKHSVESLSQKTLDLSQLRPGCYTMIGFADSNRFIHRLIILK